MHWSKDRCLRWWLDHGCSLRPPYTSLGRLPPAFPGILKFNLIFNSSNFFRILKVRNKIIMSQYNGLIHRDVFIEVQCLSYPEDQFSWKQCHEENSVPRWRQTPPTSWRSPSQTKSSFSRPCLRYQFLLLVLQFKTLKNGLKIISAVVYFCWFVFADVKTNSLGPSQ